jgi:hypothetical protein
MGVDPVSDQDELSGRIKAETLHAFGLKPWDTGGPVPGRVRIWRAVTFACRRGKAIDWRSYNMAEEQARAAGAAYLASVQERADRIADGLSEGLPDGLRFDCAPGGEGP